jgi:hypothetical protein
MKELEEVLLCSGRAQADWDGASTSAAAVCPKGQDDRAGGCSTFARWWAVPIAAVMSFAAGLVMVSVALHDLFDALDVRTAFNCCW